MAEGNLKELLIRHVEKLALGIVILIIIVYLLSLAAGTSEAHKLKSETDGAITKIKEAQESPEVPEPLEVNYAADVANSFHNVPQAGLEPRWFAFKRPYVLRRAFFERPDLPVHGAPTLSAEAKVGEVKLSWIPSDENQNIKILRYTLRRKKTAGQWLNLESLDGDKDSYLDKTVKPDAQYSYRLTSHAKEDGTQMPLNDTEQDSNEFPVEIPFNMDFETNGMMPFQNKVKIWITYVKPGGEILKSQEWIERDKMIKVKDKDKYIETGWKLKDFGVKGPGKKENSIVIVNSEGKTKRFPEEAGPPDVPKQPEEPKEPDEEPKEPDKPPKKDDGDGDDGGWLPPK